MSGVGDVGALEARIEATMQADRVPGLSIAVVGPDGVRWQRGFGVTDLNGATPASSRTPYLWFSMTKIVTATAVLRLAGTGALDLDAPVTAYVPAFGVVTGPRPVTVRHLLSHSSGLANPVPIRWVRPADAPAPDQTAFVERLLARHRRLKYVPGERTSYSNLGYLVLGEAVAAVCGNRSRLTCGPRCWARSGWATPVSPTPTWATNARRPATSGCPRR